MTSSAIQKKIYQAIKTIDDIEFLKNIQQLVYDKASRSSVTIDDDEWSIIEARSLKAKRNLNNLKSWKTVKKNILSGK